MSLDLLIKEYLSNCDTQNISSQFIENVLLVDKNGGKRTVSGEEWHEELLVDPTALSSANVCFKLSGMKEAVATEIENVFSEIERIMALELNKTK